MRLALEIVGMFCAIVLIAGVLSSLGGVGQFELLLITVAVVGTGTYLVRRRLKAEHDRTAGVQS